MQIELNPFETDALRSKYLLNSAEATMDLRNLPFTSAAEVFKSAAGIAELVPSNFWDNLPPDLESVMRANGIRPNDMRAISEHAQFLAEKPGREFDWRAFSFIAEQGPPQTPEELDNVIERANGLLLNMGYSPLVASAMVNTMQASWLGDEADLRDGLLFVEGLVQPMTLTDIQRGATTWSSLVSSLNTELGSLANRVSLTGCATIINPTSLSPMLMPSNQERTLDGSELCSAVIGEFNELEGRLQGATKAQEWWVQTLQKATTGSEYDDSPQAPRASSLSPAALPQTAPPASTPAATPSTAPAPTPAPAVAPPVAPRVVSEIDWAAVSRQVDWGAEGVRVTRADQSQFERLANAVIQEDEATFDAIEGNLVSRYGEETVRRLMSELVTKSGNTIPPVGDNR
jgi:hypothetical protein